MKQKVLSVLLALCLLAGCLPLTVSAAEVEPSACRDKAAQLRDSLSALAGAQKTVAPAAEADSPESSEKIARMEAALSDAEASQPEVAAPAQKSARASSSAAAALVSYIQRYGKLDEDGNRYVESWIETTDGASNVMRFTYLPDSYQIYFTAFQFFPDFDLGAGFHYDLATQNASDGIIVVMFVDNETDSMGGSTMFDIPHYTENTDLRFEQISGLPGTGFNEMCNTTVYWSVQLWDMALQDLGAGVSMYDLGFVSFFEAPPEPLPTQFVDVAAGQYYVDAVKWAVASNITTGTDATHFSPNGACTRAQAVTFLWRTAGSPTPENTTTAFTDVKPGAYYEKAVQWAVENGVTLGTSATKFSPDETCTRGQIVTFQYRAVNSPEMPAECPFVDVKPGAYYEDAVLWAVASGVTTGTSATKFSPDSTCTRGQIVTFLYRAFS